MADYQLTVDEALAELSAAGKARTTDPPTSWAAAGRAAGRAGSQRRLLLEAHAQTSRAGLTDAEAAYAAGLSGMSEYATRCSELLRAGLLEDAGRSRRSLVPPNWGTNEPRRTLRITVLGREVIRRGL